MAEWPAHPRWGHRPCRATGGCTARIAYARTEARRSMPIEVDQHGIPLAAEDGDQVVWADHGRLYCRQFQPEDERAGLQDWEQRGRSHFRTCAGAGEFSGTSRAREAAARG